MNIIEALLVVAVVAELLLAVELIARRRRLQAELMQAAAWSMVDPVTELLKPEAFDRRIDVELRRASREQSALVELDLPRARIEGIEDPRALVRALNPGEIGGYGSHGGVRILMLDPPELNDAVQGLARRVRDTGIETADAVARTHALRPAPVDQA